MKLNMNYLADLTIPDLRRAILACGLRGDACARLAYHYLNRVTLAELRRLAGLREDELAALEKELPDDDPE